MPMEEKCLAEARLVQGRFGEKKKRRGCCIAGALDCKAHFRAFRYAWRGL